MNIKRWVARREANWKRLETLLHKVEKKNLKALKGEELRELSSLYRSISADLARAKTYQLGNTLIRDLQNLTSRAYSQIYQGSRQQNLRAILDFCYWGFPEVVQKTWLYTAIATAIFFGGGLIAWWYAWQDPGFISLIVPEDLITRVRDEQELWMGSIIGTEPLASSQIMVNNMSVSFRVVGGGITAGLVTIYILFYNGLILGTVAALVSQNHLGYPFFAFVFPHGSLELPAIFLSGGAGLLIARGLLFPGRYRRSEALKIYGVQAAQLVFGIVPILFIAGVIESFISPQTYLPDAIKYVFGMLLLTLFLLYCNVKKSVISCLEKV